MSMTKQQRQGGGFLVTWLLLLGSGGLAFISSSCKDDPKPTVCECPNGKNHYPNNCACKADDCNCINEEEAEYREETIDLQFGVNALTATVKGTLTASQWEGLSDRIEAMIQNSFNNADLMDKLLVFSPVFGGSTAVITVDKNPAFEQWSVSNRYLIHFNYNYLAGQSDEILASNFINAVTEMKDAP